MGVKLKRNIQTGEVWNPRDLDQIDMPLELRDKEMQKSIRRAAKLLVAQGIIDPNNIVIPLSDTV